MTSPQPRVPANAPGSTGGRYSERQFTDPGGGVSLSDRTSFSGFDLRKFKVLGHGPDGPAWTATVYRANQPVVVIVDDGSADEGPQFTGMGTTMDRSAKEIQAFRFAATELYGSGPDAASSFVSTLRISAMIDRHAKSNGLSRPEAVWDFVQSSEIEAVNAPLYINGYLD